MSTLDDNGNLATARAARKRTKHVPSNRVDADGNLLPAKKRKPKIPDYKYGDDPTRMYEELRKEGLL